MGKVLFYKKGDDPEKARVYLIHGRPENLSEKRKKEGIELDIDTMPKKDQSKLDAGYKGVPYINTKTKEIIYDYVKTERQKTVEDLEARVEALEQEVVNLKGIK